MKFSKSCLLVAVALVGQAAAFAPVPKVGRVVSTSTSTSLDVTTLDDWQILDNGSVVGSVLDHPSLNNGDIITTSPLSSPAAARSQSVVTTLTGSTYKLGEPMQLKRGSPSSVDDAITLPSVGVGRRDLGKGALLTGLFGAGIASGVAITNFMQGETMTVPEAKIAIAFPNAVDNAELLKRVSDRLKKYGYGTNSLVATSLCCDEVNRPLEKELAKNYDEPFVMGGLAGFPFGGVTSFGAMAHHIPDGGSCLVVYGPHVGVDAYGTIGTVNRRGRSKGGSCCGSAAAALSKIRKGQMVPAKDSDANPPPPTDSLDAQQAYVDAALAPYAERLLMADDRNVELPYALYDAQKAMMNNIISKGAGAMEGNGNIAVLGGIQINTPEGISDYFLPLQFEIRNNQGKVIKSLLWA